MRMWERFNSGWTFKHGFDAGWIAEEVNGESISLPHTAVELPYNYFDEKCYQRAFTYQTSLAWRDVFEGREISLVFDGAMADAVVFVNGTEVVSHKDGYTPFEARLTPHLNKGSNLITVRVDGSENPEIPPFGGVIDYLTYAGIYRDVWLKATAPVSVGLVKIETPDALAEEKTIKARVALSNPQGLSINGEIGVTLKGSDGETIACHCVSIAAETVEIELAGLRNIQLWDIDDPRLYTLELELDAPSGRDTSAHRFGFRTAEFTTDGFKLNGRVVKLRGLNRHQSWAHLGYAMGQRGQEKDADILKHDLRCNIVRTSHYPQSPYFLNRCDEIGLLVFEEIPGWQHIGGESWKAGSVRNVRRMIERDWNHPSIIIWGVRINESKDDHDFYVETNRVARELDPTRQTGGVRYIPESEMLEDVFTMNDFILGMEELPGHNRDRIILRDQQEVTGLDRKVPYLVTEYGGHMYPTKRFDQEQRQLEHVSRHLAILNASAGTPSTSGCIGWCMADYNTHKDFGSGDRICYHGVLDIYREPKFAAAVYASQGSPSDGVVLQPVTFWARGERNIGGVLPLIVLTNCDYVEVKIGNVTKRIEPDRVTYPHLDHPPCILERHMVTPEEFGEWGMTWRDGTIIGYLDGVAVKSIFMPADPVPTNLEMVADTDLLEKGCKDTTRVILRALDQAGNVMPFFNEPVTLALEGPGRLIGGSLVSFKGGVVGVYVEAGESSGVMTLTAHGSGFQAEKIEITVS
ncbi:glycoside hydrolase family 2 protein [Rhizobium rhizoryzae]|uniref:Beta-galactosidase n=1 Tax=Rhizobium rhizoryzae TaxID=451876 RepID=A0A7W6LGZ4_9HYPH|nr:glycoside hydrolase family 2 protein [Rhizobium rhizoryzae]MBB4144234.1 beta-galactosidase [Rhizobium rhizoryzae]